ncbi:hypothetical protein [Sulfurimonas sp. NWX79]|uniref:hypothetical protein n=1 Tax=Sulfurimonas sp. NWX79 TaxID=2925412 RepID=UPI003204CDC2
MHFYLLSTLIGLTVISTSLFAEDIAETAKKFNLYGGQKATIQWKRVFSSPRHLKRYKLDTLSQETRTKLQAYLIEHAADSDQPIVPGL